MLLDFFMNISKVKNAIKVGRFYLRKDKSPNKIGIKYYKEDLLSKKSSMVYIITENKIIKKIGESSCDGGIKATMSFYVNAMQGSPGRSRFITHLLIARSLKMKKKVELYIISSSLVTAKIKGLVSWKRVKISSSKEMERFCKEQYYEKEKGYPDWNFKENRKDYPKVLEKKFMKYHEKRLKKSKKR